MRDLLEAIKDRLGNAGRGAVVVFVLQGFGALAAYGLEILLARFLGPNVYGAYSWVMSWVILLGVPATLGLQHAVVRFIPEYQERGEWHSLRGLLVGSWLLVVTGGIIIGAIAFFVMRTGAGPESIYSVAAVGLGMAMVPLRSTLELQLNIARSFDKLIVGYSPLTVLRPLLLGVALVLLARENSEHIGLMPALWATGGVFLGLSLAQCAKIWRSLPPSIQQVAASFHFPEWISVALPLALAGAAFIAIERTDVIMMGILVDQSVEVGRFHAASRTASVVGYVVFSLNATAGPLMARYKTAGNLVKLQNLAGRISRWGFAGTVMLGGALVLMSDTIMGLFGEAFTGLTGILTILIGAHVLSASVGSVGYLLNMTGHHMISAATVGIVAVLNVGLNAVLIPPMGALGAAVATFTAVVLWNVLLRAKVIQHLQIEPSLLYDIRRYFGR